MVGSGFEATNISGLKVTGGDWSFVNMRYQDLVGFKLVRVKLKGADFAGANLSKCDLTESVLDEANLFQTNLTSADLRRASLNKTDLRPANLNKSRMDIAQAIHFAQCYGIIVE